jgi:hypothetical protein
MVLRIYTHKTLVVNVKEKTMTNKKIWLGMLVMVLVFGMTVVGCDSNFYVTVQNATNFEIESVFLEDGGIRVIGDLVNIAPGESRTYDTGRDTPSTIKISVTVGIEDVEVIGTISSGSEGWGPGEDEAKTMILSGTTKETLKISQK